MNRLMLGLCVPFLSIVSLVAFASDQVLRAERGDFDRQWEEVLSELANGTTYAEITESDRELLVTLGARIKATLSKASSVEALREADRLQLFNDQERVNALLTQARDDSRVVCRREVPVGSRMPQVYCLTVAERRELRDGSREQLRQNVHLRNKSNSR